MRLIDADALLEKLAWLEEYDHIIFDSVKRSIEEVPTVSLVRCKDCIHYWKNKPSDDVPVCLASPKDDAFCSEGERREDG